MEGALDGRTSAPRVALSARPAETRAAREHGDPVERSMSAPSCARPRTPPAKNPDGGATAMPTYIMLSTLTPEGVQTVKNNPQRIQEVNKEVEQLGATVKAQWATLGHVDFISVVEAPDEATMARVSLELGSRGTGRFSELRGAGIGGGFK